MIGHFNDNLLHSKLTNIGRIPTAVALAVVITLSGCRGGDDVAPIDPDFIQAPDPDHFNVFLNDEPAVPKAGISSVDEIHNVDDFPEAYYNTIDPQNSRTTLDDWKTANGFLNADGSLPACDAQNCCVPEAEVTDQCLFVKYPCIVP